MSVSNNDEIAHKLWKAIHIVGITFSPRSDNATESFICFFECLKDLLPDINMSRSLSSFMLQFPIDNFLNTSVGNNNSGKAFEWTYKLHAYINLIKKRQGQLTNDITLDQALDKYKNVNKTDWSHSFWFLLHYITANLPDRLNDNQILSMKAFVVCIRYLIPCDECKVHMAKYLSMTEIDQYLSRRETIFTWTVVFHNNVSTRVKKPLMSVQDAMKLYRNDEVYSYIDE